ELGVLFSSRGAEDDAERMYRLSLEYSPRHAMSANNLGFHLLEREGGLAEAARLIEVAAAERSDEPSVLDSLGWLRYRQGVIEDQRAADGAVVRRGAVSLIQDSIKLDQDGGLNPTRYDHLGDALWLRATPESRAEAAFAWNLAEQGIRAVLEGVPISGQGDAELRARLGRLERLVRAKQLAALRGEEPEVAPHGPINTAEPHEPPARATDEQPPPGKLLHE
ncbi:MAG: hypothetical protein H7Y88_04210, partial [Phycisphaerales bacterium]|nr:hypothetical protein [Phycisphaerales bacterium]